MNVKICGITTAQEIKYINKLKPEYIGFVFTKSKRQISIATAKELIGELDKEILVVGVFKDNSLEEIENVIEEVKLDVIQLHGSEDNEFIKKLKIIIRDVLNTDNRNKIIDKFKNENTIQVEKVEIWKGISIKNEEDIKKSISLNVDNFILDGGNPGSGESFNWNLISGINKDRKFFLAGGVGLNNIDEIVNNIKPYGVDVSSGVEIVDSNGKRKKDYYKMKILIEKVRKII
ncbi:MAG: phosphoribosylanthranilate isomerase [Clostridium sp.]